MRGDAELEPWQEPPQGRCVDASILQLSGIEQVSAIIDGSAPKPGIHYLTGMRPTSVGDGEATFTMPASEWLRDATGAIDPSVLNILADGPLGSAFQTRLPPATPYTTLELSMNHLQPAALGGDLEARSRIVGSPKAGLTDVRITDAGGQLVAYGTCRCLVLPAPKTMPPAQGAPPSPSHAGQPVQPPYQRTPRGAIMTAADLNVGGRQRLQQRIDGERGPSPIEVLTGRRPTAAGAGMCRLELPATPWLYSPFPRVEGGVIAMLAEAAMASAAQTTLGPGVGQSTLDTKVNFLRPVLGDGSNMRVDAQVIHRTRRLAMTRCTITDGGGRTVALASGTSSFTFDESALDEAA